MQERRSSNVLQIKNGSTLFILERWNFRLRWLRLLRWFVQVQTMYWIHLSRGEVYTFIKRGGLYIYQEGRFIHFSRGGDPINWFNNATFLCLSQDKTWISNVIWHGLFCVLWVQLKWEMIVRFVDICGIDDLTV
jgi:hypothetical protein